MTTGKITTFPSPSLADWPKMILHMGGIVKCRPYLLTFCRISTSNTFIMKTKYDGKVSGKRNPFARDLAHRKYRQRTVPPMKGRQAPYNRQKESSRKAVLRELFHEDRPVLPVKPPCLSWLAAPAFWSLFSRQVKQAPFSRKNHPAARNL